MCELRSCYDVVVKSSERLSFKYRDYLQEQPSASSRKGHPGSITMGRPVQSFLLRVGVAALSRISNAADD